MFTAPHLICQFSKGTTTSVCRISAIMCFGPLRPLRQLCHWGPFIAIFLMLYITTNAVICALVVWPPLKEDPLSVAHCSLLVIWCFIIFYHYFYAMFLGPGFVPKGWKPVGIGLVISQSKTRQRAAYIWNYKLHSLASFLANFQVHRFLQTKCQKRGSGTWSSNGMMNQFGWSLYWSFICLLTPKLFSTLLLQEYVHVELRRFFFLV